MKRERYCKICNRFLSEQNPGTLCIICQDKIAKDYDEKPYYDVENLKCILGLDSNEQVRRLGREGKIPGKIPGIKQHHYLKTEVDRWLASAHLFSQGHPKPVGPLQEEAYRLCQQGIHGWMLEERFNGQACTSEVSSEIVNSIVQMTVTYKCYFCKYEETTPYVA